MIVFFIFAVVVGLVSDVQGCSVDDVFNKTALGTCSGYWQCQAGILTFKKCPYSYTFNSETLSCDWNPLHENRVPCDKNKGFSADVRWCSKGKFFKAAVAGDCRSYYLCQDGVLKVDECVWPAIFNLKEQECELNVNPNPLECPGADKPPRPSSPLQTEWRPECKKGRSFLLVDPHDCSKYLRCEDGILTSQQCGFFEKFDAESLECRWFDVKCSNTKNLILSPMSCVETNYYKTVKSDNCQEYYECSDGQLRVKQCPDNTNFDPQTHQCLRSPTLNCSSPIEKIMCKEGYSYKTVGPDEYTFYQCKRDGTLILDQCDNFKQFDPATQSCMFSLFGVHLSTTKVVEEWIAQAQHMFETENPDTTSNQITAHSENLYPEPRCGEDSLFSLPYRGDCNKYLKCQKGTFNIMECPYGRKFDNLTQSCIDMNQCDLLTCHSKGPICYPGVSYRIPSSVSCSKYYECEHGQWHNYTCPLFHKFSPTSLQCESHLFSAVNCTAPPSCARTLLANVTAQPLILKKIQQPHPSYLIDFKSSGWPKCAPGQSYKSAFPYDCSKYYHCMDGNVTIDSCPMFDRFDANLLDCRFNTPWDPVVCDTNPGKPQCGVDQKYETSFPYDCAKYYKCDKGNLTVESCSYLDKFDPKTLTCRFSWNPLNPVDCNSSPGEPVCERGEYFKKVYPERCNRYYQCNNGTLTQQQCLFWQKFDPATLQCRLNVPYLDPVNCSATPGSGLVGKFKVKRPTMSQIDPTPPLLEKNIDEGPKCTEGVRFKTVLHQDCGKYIVCKNGTETVEKCPWFMKFNPATLSCRWDFPLYRVNCSAQTPPHLSEFPTRLKEACKRGISFKNVDKGDCESYWKCDEGILSYEVCGRLQKFDPASLSCSLDLPFHRVNCTALPGEPECPMAGQLRKPYPVNCNKYYECNNGTLRVENCALFQKFDHSQLQCKYELPFVKINCGYD